jgi:hypothetical protein
VSPQRAKEWLDQALANGDAVMNDDGSVTVTLAPEVVATIQAMAEQIQENPS